MNTKFAVVHPREILLEEFLKPMKLSQYALAKDISVPARRINEIVHGERAISADTALRLSRYFVARHQFVQQLDHFNDHQRLAGAGGHPERHAVDELNVWEFFAGFTGLVILFEQGRQLAAGEAGAIQRQVQVGLQAGILVLMKVRLFALRFGLPGEAIIFP
jgi:addiction module HigA family antidote